MFGSTHIGYSVGHLAGYCVGHFARKRALFWRASFILTALSVALAGFVGTSAAGTTANGTAEILIVGAGPSALANALMLAQQDPGAHIRLVDSGKAPYTLPPNRSLEPLLVLHGRTLDYFELMANINLAKMVGATLLKGRSDIYGLKEEGRSWWSHRMEEYLPHQASQDEATADDDIRVTLARIGDPQPRAIVERSAMHKALYDAAIKRGVQIDYEKKVVDVEKTGRSVTVQIANTETSTNSDRKGERADLVIFADGPNSTLLQSKGIEFSQYSTNGDVIYARSNNAGDRMLRTIEGIAGARLATIHGHTDGLGLFINRRDNLGEDAQTAAEKVAKALGISHIFPVSQHNNIKLSHPNQFLLGDRTIVSAGATYGNPVLGLDLNFRILGAVILGAAYEGILRGDTATLTYYNELMKIGSETVVSMGRLEPPVPLKSDMLPTFVSPISKAVDSLVARAEDKKALEKITKEIIDSGESPKHGSKERMKYTKERFTADGRSPSTYINSFYNGASDELSAVALKVNTTSTTLSSIDGNRDTRTLTWGQGPSEAKYLYKDNPTMFKLKKRRR